MVDVPPFDRNLPRAGIRNDLKHDPIQENIVLLEVVRIAFEHDVTAAHPLPELEGPGADRLEIRRILPRIRAFVDVLGEDLREIRL